MLWHHRLLSERSSADEYMDARDFSAADMCASFRVIELVNRFLGGHKVVLDALDDLLEGWPRREPVHVLDVGCGLNSLGARIQALGRKRGQDIRYTGIDRNEQTVLLARAASGDGHISYAAGDILDTGLPSADIIIASAVLHHLSGRELVSAIGNLVAHCRKALIVSDLLRSPATYGPAYLLSRCIRNTAARRDGLLSIKKGFLPDEMARCLSGRGLEVTVRKRYLYRLVAVARKSR
jgi:2-polyprenyl-3-methyl-5-hydroxy-6-metoxy-1,4-benzoquinol methylase